MCEYIIIRHQKGKKSLPSNPLKRNYHRLCEIKRHIFTYHIHVFQSTYKRACHREQCIMQNVFFYRLYSSDWSIPDTIKKIFWNLRMTAYYMYFVVGILMTIFELKITNKEKDGTRLYLTNFRSDLSIYSIEAIFE